MRAVIRTQLGMPVETNVPSMTVSTNNNPRRGRQIPPNKLSGNCAERWKKK